MGDLLYQDFHYGREQYSQTSFMTTLKFKLSKSGFNLKAV